MKQLVENYTFDKVTKQVTFTDFTALELERILLITDTTNNTVIYQFNNAALKGTVATNVLTLNYNTNTASFANGDALQIWYETTGPVKIGHGSKNVTSAGTAVQLATSSTPCISVSIQSKSANTGSIAVGAAGVNASTPTGVLLGAGDSVTINIANLNLVYIDSTVSGEGVTFTYVA